MCGYHRFRGGEPGPEPVSEELQELTAYDAFGKSFGSEAAVYSIVCNKLYARDVIGDIRFPAQKVNEDEFMVYRFLRRADKIAVLPDELYSYRIREGSITQDDGYLLNLDAFEAYEERLALYKAEGWTEYIPKIKKQVLDLYMSRYIKGQQARNRDRKGWRRYFLYYRESYKQYRKDVPGMGYAVFAISPSIYALLLNLKKMTLRLPREAGKKLDI